MSLATFIDDLAADMQARGLGTVGTNLFIGQIPEKNADGTPLLNALLLIPYGGAPSDNIHAAAHPRVQVTARNTSYAAASTKIHAVYAAYNEREGFDVGTSTTTHVVDCMAQQTPFSLGQDERQAWRLVCNFQFTIQA